MFGRRFRVELSVNILDAADTMLCGKCIAMTLNMHRDALSALGSPSAIFGCARASPHAALNVRERRFVENTPWYNSPQDGALSCVDIRDVLALNLRRLRQAKGLSQEELAHQAEIDRTYVSALERSVYAAGIDVVDRLARVLGVEAADLLKRPTPKAKKGR